MKKQIFPAIIGLVILFVLGWYVDSIARNAITQTIRFVIYGVAYSVVSAIVVGLILVILLIRERFLKEQASRKLAQRETTVMVVKADEGQQVYIRDMDTEAVWRNAHLDSRVYANGLQSIPNTVELTAWQTWTLRNKPTAIREITHQLLPATTQVDLLAELTTVQRCLIVGPTDSGKTTLLQHIVSHRLQTSKVIVIDPHAYPDKWSGCAVVGTGRNYPEINKALTALVQIMSKRYQEIGKGIIVEGNHPKLTILIDEWRAIVFQLGKPASEAIKALLTESRKAAFSVFVATHSERVKALGIEGEGDLKDGFAVVRLSIVNGQRQATLDKGNGEIPAILPSPYIGQQIIDTDDFFNLEVQPTPAEAAILNLYEQGESYNEIARQVFGNTGGKQTERIKQVISKFN